MDNRDGCPTVDNAGELAGRIAFVECLGIAIIGLGIALAALVLVAGSARARTDRWNEAFAFVAQRFHGRLTPAGWFSEPVVQMQYGTAVVRLTCLPLSGQSKRKCLQMVLQLRDQRTVCEFLSRPASSRLAPQVRGLAEISLEWGKQYERWQVLAADGDEARHLCTQGVRLALDRLWLTPLPSDTAVSLMPGWMVIRKAWTEPRGADVEQFVEAACTLHDQLQVAVAAGIEFVVGEEAQLLDDAVCSVCCEKLDAEVVFCGRCQTPHHRDCWEYSGGCSTYGCGGRQCFVPGTATLAPPHYSSGKSQPIRPAKPR